MSTRPVHALPFSPAVSERTNLRHNCRSRGHLPVMSPERCSESPTDLLPDLPKPQSPGRSATRCPDCRQHLLPAHEQRRARRSTPSRQGRWPHLHPPRASRRLPRHEPPLSGPQPRRPLLTAQRPLTRRHLHVHAESPDRSSRRYLAANAARGPLGKRPSLGASIDARRCDDIVMTSDTKRRIPGLWSPGISTVHVVSEGGLEPPRP